MNILITGAGLIGAHAARQMVDAGHKVVLFDLSPNRDYIGKVVGKDKADVVAANMLNRGADSSRPSVDTLEDFEFIGQTLLGRTTYDFRGRIACNHPVGDDPQFGANRR